MKLLLLILLLFLPITPPNTGCLEMDIMLLGDLSGSIDGREEFVADALEAFVARFDLGENTLRIGVAVFSFNLFEISNITHDKNKLLTGINYIRTHRMGSTTNLSNAVEYVSYQFTEFGRPRVKKMLIIISDGDVNQPSKAVMAIRKLIKQHNVFICGVYVDIKAGGNEDFMSFISNEACFVSSTYEILVEELERLDICL